MTVSHPDLAAAVRMARGNGAAAPADERRPSWHDRTFSAAALQTMTFPPPKFILPGLVPEGATLLVSRPKLGKSWLVLDVAIAIAAERFTLGELKPLPGDVLYLSLEDGRRRMQSRITKLLPTFTTTWPPRLTLATEWSRASQGGLSDIEEWIRASTMPRLVIVDTLAQFRNVANGNPQVYAEDYAAISGLQKLASQHNIGMLIVHHDRKSEADDVFDTVSGSLGLTGAADTILIMKRQAGAVTLHVRGRDIEECEIALRFEKSSCRWSILGAAAEVHRSDERKRVIEALREEGGPLRAKDIWLVGELRSRNATDLLLKKMAKDGEVVRTDRGIYALPEAKDGQIGQTDRNGVQAADLTAPSDILSDLSNLSGPQTSSPRPPLLGPAGDSLDDFV